MKEETVIRRQIVRLTFPTVEDALAFCEAAEAVYCALPLLMWVEGL